MFGLVALFLFYRIFLKMHFYILTAINYQTLSPVKPSYSLRAHTLICSNLQNTRSPRSICFQSVEVRGIILIWWKFSPVWRCQMLPRHSNRLAPTRQIASDIGRHCSLALQARLMSVFIIYRLSMKMYFYIGCRYTCNNLQCKFIWL
jgi:hypothetical protein